MKVAIETICPRCHAKSTVTVTNEGLERYRSGTLLQEAFPELSDSDREKIKTGFCENCWKEIFGDEEDG